MSQIKIADLAEQLLRTDPSQISQNFASEHAADLAAALQKIEPRQAWTILENMAVGLQADIFGYLDVGFQARLATIMPQADLAAVFMAMDSDDRADLYKKLSDEQRDALMRHASSPGTT